MSHVNPAQQTLTDIQLECWRLLQEERTADHEHIRRRAQLDAQRTISREPMLDLLRRFLAGGIDLETFRATFDRNTRTEWDEFGFKGLSSAMFLNTLVKHVADQDEVTRQLSAVLPAPSEAKGHSQMQRFYDYLIALERTGDITRRQVQVARIPFFVSGWWHLQEPETWPIFYPTGRRALEQEGVYTPSSDPIAHYVAFRASFLALAEALQLSSWELEHLLAWYDQAGRQPIEPEETLPAQTTGVGASTTALADDESADDDDVDPVGHTQIQLLLAQIGRKLGCRVWIARNDHNRTWQDTRLGNLSLDVLPPLGLDPESQQMISLIDVIWLQGHQRVVAAFEVEHTTSVYSGLLRMSDLVTVTPNLNFPLYIVAPAARMDKVNRELSRPTFQMLGLHEQCGYFSFEDLLEAAPSIMRWASEPSAIDRLAQRVESVSRGW